MSAIAATHARLATGGSDDWQTPACVLDRVRRIAPIGLDPCTAQTNPVGADIWYHLGGQDGLAATWAGAGLVYVNFPYSQAAAWSLKLVNETIAARPFGGVEIVSLVAARPDVRWFWRLGWDTAQAVCFWKGRLRFVGASSSAPFPSAVAYHGQRPWAFEAAFQDAGKVVRL